MRWLIKFFHIIRQDKTQQCQLNNYKLMKQKRSWSEMILGYNLKIEDLILVNNQPCKVISLKQWNCDGCPYLEYIEVKGLSIFSNELESDVNWCDHFYDPVEVNFEEYELLDIGNDNYLILLKENGEYKEDVNLYRFKNDDYTLLCDEIKNKVEEGKSLKIKLLTWEEEEKIVGYEEIEVEIPV